MKYFKFQFIFYVKTATPLKKVTPVFPSNHPLRSCQAPPFWKFSRRLNPPSPPPAEREEAYTLWSLFELKYDDTIDMSTII